MRALRLARLADVAAVQDQPVVRVLRNSGGHDLHQLVLDRAHVLPGASPVRLATRKMCVSTAIVGSPNAVLRTTFAVLRPTPGSASSASRVRGTSPPCCSTRMRHSRDHVLRLGVVEPDRLMYALSPSSPSSRIACGVFATGNSLRVALLTPSRWPAPKHHRDQQLERRAVFELRRRMRVQPSRSARRSRGASRASRLPATFSLLLDGRR